jgi:hypothetical protein
VILSVAQHQIGFVECARSDMDSHLTEKSLSDPISKFVRRNVIQRFRNERYTISVASAKPASACRG